MRVRRTAVLFAVILVVGMLPVPSSARASGEGQFRTPSGNIGCGYYDRVLRCDVRDGIKPLPPRPASCNLDWGQGFWLHEHGPAHIVCAGDTALNPTAPVVRYGMTWQGDRIGCASSTSGLRCTNADRHGFFLSRGQAYRF